MLHIHMPEDRQKNERRKAWRALTYAATGIILFTAVFAADGTTVWWLPCLITAWWVWATLTDPRIK